MPLGKPIASSVSSRAAIFSSKIVTVGVGGAGIDVAALPARIGRHHLVEVREGEQRRLDDGGDHRIEGMIAVVRYDEPGALGGINKCHCDMGLDIFLHDVEDCLGLPPAPSSPRPYGSRRTARDETGNERRAKSGRSKGLSKKLSNASRICSSNCLKRGLWVAS